VGKVALRRPQATLIGGDQTIPFLVGIVIDQTPASRSSQRSPQRMMVTRTRKKSSSLPSRKIHCEKLLNVDELLSYLGRHGEALRRAPGRMINVTEGCNEATSRPLLFED
jgi:hypothetical protein